MKKLLLGALILLSSFACIAQETSTFVKKYTSMISLEDNVAGEWVYKETTVVFNPEGRSEVKFYFPNGNTYTYYQVGDVTEGATEEGSDYQLIECLTEEGKTVMIQLFKDDKCVRVLISKGYRVEFHKE
jgi:hypothetical protein